MPSVLTHPLAPRPQARAVDAPRYLVRSDGLVTAYSPALAKLPNFTPANELPAAHVAASQAAAQRDERVRQVRLERQAQLEAAELALLVRQGVVSVDAGRGAAGVAGAAAAGGVVAKVGASSTASSVLPASASSAGAAASVPAVSAVAPAAAVAKPGRAGAAASAGVAVAKAAAPPAVVAGAKAIAGTVKAPALDIGTADKATLKAFFAGRQVKADLRRPVEELRALAHEVARTGRAPGAA